MCSSHCCSTTSVQFVVVYSAYCSVWNRDLHKSPLLDRIMYPPCVKLKRIIRVAQRAPTHDATLGYWSSRKRFESYRAAPRGQIPFTG